MASSKATRARRKATGPSTAEIPLATPNSPAKPISAKSDRQRLDVALEPVEPGAGPQEAGPAEVAHSGPPLWLQLVSLTLALVGLAISAYETWAHFHGSHLAGCSSSAHATFDCTAVITSPQSMVFGVIPVAVLGLAFYVFAVPIMTPWAWRARRREVHWLRLASLVVGMGFVMYLIYAEVYQIQEVCEYCTGVHIVTFLLFCITVISAAIWGLRPSSKSAQPA
jgi:uncharacterized membrane protein